MNLEEFEHENRLAQKKIDNRKTNDLNSYNKEDKAEIIQSPDAECISEAGEKLSILSLHITSNISSISKMTGNETGDVVLGPLTHASEVSVKTLSTPPPTKNMSDPPNTNIQSHLFKAIDHSILSQIFDALSILSDNDKTLIMKSLTLTTFILK